MKRIERFKVCLNPECQQWLPTCPKCSAEMTKRQGRNGEFWGCRNYRYEGESCKHTENDIQFSASALD